MTNNKKENLIIWQKWSDPFGEDDMYDLSANEMNDFIEDEEASKELDSVEQQEPILKSRKNIRVMATPMGIIPVTDNTASGKIFNFWIGHTNFNVTKKITSIIEETDGVETLDIFTRYRFRIAVGKAFDDSSVMRTINDNVYSYLE